LLALRKSGARVTALEATRIHVLERCTLPALLGLRFWDVGAGALVEDGLAVRVQNSLGTTVDATQNRSGVWHFPKLPGISAADVARVVAAGGSVAELARPFNVRVSDGASRFQPVQFELMGPAVGGLFAWPYGGLQLDTGSPPGSAPAPVPLFSSPGRVAPAARLTVRADLWDIERDRPAAWALLEVSAPSASGVETFLGLANERGSVCVFLPMPFLPVDGSNVAIAARTWNVEVRVAYAPSLTLDAMTPSGVLVEPPGLDAILAQRELEPASAFATRSPDALLSSAVLTSRQPLVLQTQPFAVESRLQSFLLVRPAP